MSLLTFCTASPSLSLTQGRDKGHKWRKIKEMVEKSGVSSSVCYPVDSLKKGNWVKLICGASFEDVADIRNLSLVYTLAGVDCIDCAADASIVNAVNEGISVAKDIVSLRSPWIMISVNDDVDLHFRKAEFDPSECPPNCSRPCEKVCPADAITLQRVTSDEGLPLEIASSSKLEGGVIRGRCYGCGRCFPVCPYDKIRSNTYVRCPTATAELLKRNNVDAIEIHTSAREINSFEKLWNSLADFVGHLNLVALDGRPMSGDIGRGATRDAIAFAARMSSIKDKPHGFLQLAGGTNFHTVGGLKEAGLFQTPNIQEDGNDVHQAERFSGWPYASIGGVAYGGYARKIVGRVLNKMQSEEGPAHIERYPDYLVEALEEALSLVGPVKCYTLS
ncbi:uncharacterized protein LOC18431263 isoform X3 [Amborella trichopoda]|uniref:uncharacterized protein LOC18431263 isoform X3 n=1 Tax=Amborella trichopoda TaxID=13333 RepID=UPI0009C0003E|nr:uncharacterized protein LOC18431263 isoform X3 [Amborella trichopoda]|eukprot:XP_020521328.1 uncharacterized protein LOC18431263 isoform X3 [Amborella trichopoda]